MSALVLAAWIAATVARLATALRHAAERLAPHHPPSAPEEIPETRFTIHETETAVLVDNANGETVAAFSKLSDGDVAIAWVTDEATERARADAKRYVDVTIACGTTVAGRRPWTDTREALDADPNPCLACRAIDHAAETAADVADPRALAIEVARTQDDIREDVAVEGARIDPRGFLMLVRLSRLRAAALAARVERYRAAVTQPAAIKLHYVRSYREALCGAAYPGSRCTGDPQRWHAEPPATRCPTCAAELRRADPHRFDTRLQGITDTSGDADELLRGSR